MVSTTISWGKAVSLNFDNSKAYGGPVVLLTSAFVDVLNVNKWFIEAGNEAKKVERRSYMCMALVKAWVTASCLASHFMLL